MELHVSQDGSLAEAGIDLAVIEAIAAPDRSEITIGKTPIEPDDKEPPNVRYLNISIQGSSDHSGATPMDVAYRADSLALSSRFITTGILGSLEDLRKQGKDVDVSIGSLSIESQALNKIPGRTAFTIRIGGNDVQAINDLLKDINLHAEAVGIFYNGRSTERQTVVVEELQQQPANERFYKSSDIIPRQKLAARIIQIVRATARSYQIEQKKNVVGTVGTYTLNKQGQIILGLDIRGTDKEERTAAVQEIFKQIEEEDELVEIRKLPGNTDPTSMDPRLVSLAEEVIKENNLGSYIVTFSRAGQDTQNAAQVGIPTVVIFIPSRNGGASHSPEEYSTPEDLARGAKTLAALTMTLAS